MRKKGFLGAWLLMGLVAGATAQTTTLTGRVTDAGTGQPLPFATVYIDGTTRGTLTDDQGEYTLPNVPLGSVELAASYVGYRPAKLPLRLTGGPHRVPLALQPDAATLQAVTVTARKPKAWQRQFRQFKAALLGESVFASSCEISNGRVVEFSEKDGHLLATAPEPLVIENRALGYRLYYQLLYFDWYRGILYYAGHSRFEELTPESPAQAAHWRKARQRAYEGSTRHLMASLIRGTHEQAGFQVFKARFAVPADAQGPVLRAYNELGPRVVKTDTLFRPGELPFERELVLSSCLEIFNTRVRGRSPYPELPYAYTVLYLPQGHALLTTSGWVVNPQGMETRGYLGGDRLATLLPADWEPTGTVPATSVLAQAGGTRPGHDPRLDSLGMKDAPPPYDPLVFLHPDKPLYTTGDRLWLSAYLLDPTTHQPLADRSGATGELHNPALYVELLTADGQRVLHQWQAVREGRAAGDFRLSDSLTTGVYRLRAYSEGSRDTLRPAFERALRVQSGLAAPVFTPQDPAFDSLDVQVLPEGGRWVAGLPARLGVKVLDRRGWGQPVTVAILNEQNAEVAQTTTNARGLGHLDLTPAPGQRYRAVARWGTLEQPAALPPPEAEGLSLRADALSDSSFIRLRIGATSRYEGQPVYALLKSRDQVRVKARLLVRNGVAGAQLPTAPLSPGVCQLTVFDSTGTPLAERLLFVPDPEAPGTLTITPGKPRYEPREAASFALRLLDGAGQPLVLSGSVSITDADQVDTDTTEADLRTYLLLTHALRGRVENPAGYLRKTDPATRQALDDLLLTQGWRRFVASTEAPPDSLGNLTLRGRVLDRRGQPLPSVNVLLTSVDDRQPVGFSARTDAAGRFRVSGAVFGDTLRLRSRVTDAAFKTLPEATVRLEPAGRVFGENPTALPRWVPTPQRWETARRHQETDLDAYRERDARQLAGVVVRATKRPDDAEARRVSLHGTPDAALVFDESAASRFANAYEMIRGRVAGVQVRELNGQYSVLIGGISSFGGSAEPLYLLDGNYLQDDGSGNVLLRINPTQVERVEFVKFGGGAAYGARGANGVIAFFSRKGGKLKPGLTTDELTAYGFATPREFYLPRYGENAPDSVKTDRRDVLFWNPRLTTSNAGFATLRFPLSDAVRSLRIVVQGITAEGEPVAIERVVRVR
jgi:hypothetical protein